MRNGLADVEFAIGRDLQAAHRAGARLLQSRDIGQRHHVAAHPKAQVAGVELSRRVAIRRRELELLLPRRDLRPR